MVVEFVSMITDLYSIDIKLVRMGLNEPTDHFYDKSVGTVAVKKIAIFVISLPVCTGVQCLFYCCPFVPFHGIERKLDWPTL